MEMLFNPDSQQLCQAYFMWKCFTNEKQKQNSNCDNDLLQIMEFLNSNVKNIPFSCLEINRSSVLVDALFASQNGNVNLRNRIKVSFVGEDGYDAGGLSREFFRLFVLQFSELFLTGPSERKFFVNNICALQRQDMLHIGHFVAHSIAIGCGGMPIFAEPVYQYICTGRYNHQQILDMDLPDNLQRVILKVRQSTTNDELQNVFATTEEQDLLLQCGFSTPLSSLSITMRDTLVSVIVDYHCIVKCIAMMDQFRQGLNLLGVLDMVQMHPHIMKKFFVHHNRVLSCDALIDMFGQQITFLSEEEEKSFCFFVQFLQECEAGTLVCTLKDVLIFFTGSDSIPPFGKVDFEASKLPQSSTCDYLLKIPTEHSDYESFKEFFQLGALGHDGFGVT
eukprot:Em0008g568a